MGSRYFVIEVYGDNNYGCPDYNLMGYTSIMFLLADCWIKWKEENKLKDKQVGDCSKEPKEE